MLSGEVRRDNAMPAPCALASHGESSGRLDRNVLRITYLGPERLTAERCTGKRRISARTDLCSRKECKTHCILLKDSQCTHHCVYMH